MVIDFKKNNVLDIGKNNEFYLVIFKDQMRTYNHIIKGSKFEILNFLIKNCNIYNLRNNVPENLTSNEYVDYVINIIKKRNDNKQFSNAFFFADGQYNYIFHELNKINNNIQTKKKTCLIL
tara:strand:+ start:1645 stop:2007 length:363 start_codon:yes stop_codon:yes gene_type:complete